MRSLALAELVPLTSMKIATKSGDKGNTGRLFGTRVKKTEPAIHAVGDVDELNAALGMLKAEMREGKYYSYIEELQHKLTLYMGELAAEKQKRAEYVEKYDYVKDYDLELLDAKVNELQAMSELDQQGWVLYGNSKLGALADFSSKVCRRAERSVMSLYYLEDPLRPTLVKYINRLSDFLHLLGRYYDYQAKTWKLA